MDIKEFCTKTKLELREVEGTESLYAECSGKEYYEIKNLIRHYNDTDPDHKAFCWDDPIKDVTYIKFI